MNARSLLRAVNTVTGHVAPELPARIAGRLMLHPRRHAMRPWEAAAADSARRITFRFGLSGLRWGERGPAVLMMHGWEGRPTQFRYFIEPLLASGRQVIALDGPAHGQSAGEQSSLMEFAAAIGEAAVEIRELETVIGHSLGAAATAIALSQGLPAERAVLIASPASIEKSLQGYAGALGLTPRASERFISLIGQANGVPARELDIARLARTMTIPALIVHDGDDRAVPFTEGEAIARAWPDARLLATRGLGHWRVLTDPAVTQGVAEFLDGHDAGLTAGELRAMGGAH